MGAAWQECARWWSYRRQRLGQAAPDLVGALRDVIGVYSAHPSGPLSLYARVPCLTAGAFRRLDVERLALRLPAMRRSIYMLPRQSAHLAFRATALPHAVHDEMVRRHGFGEARYRELRGAILSAAQEPRTARQLRADVGSADRSLLPVLRALTYEGLLLRVGAAGLRSNQVAYVATETWLGEPLPQAAAAGALAWLAGEYLRAFGPARSVDFKWWAGVTMDRARAALAAVDCVEVGGGYLLPNSDINAFEVARAPGRDTLDLLPKWDSYTMGYAPDGRRRFVHPDVQPRIYDPTGNGLGVVLVNGTAVGAWHMRMARKRLQVRLDLFERPGERLERDMSTRFEAIAALLDARGLDMANEEDRHDDP